MCEVNEETPFLAVCAYPVESFIDRGPLHLVTTIQTRNAALLCRDGIEALTVNAFPPMRSNHIPKTSTLQSSKVIDNQNPRATIPKDLRKSSDIVVAMHHRVPCSEFIPVLFSHRRSGVRTSELAFLFLMKRSGEPRFNKISQIRLQLGGTAAWDPLVGVPYDLGRAMLLCIMLADRAGGVLGPPDADVWSLSTTHRVPHGVTENRR
jgi:hypothetical protein